VNAWLILAGVAQEAREREIAAEAVDAAINASAQAISAIKVQHRTITQEVERDVIEKPVYRDPGCRHDADSLQRLNAALTGAARPEPAGSGVVPRAGAAD
jgi:hypothetical protein